MRLTTLKLVIGVGRVIPAIRVLRIQLRRPLGPLKSLAKRRLLLNTIIALYLLILPLWLVDRLPLTTPIDLLLLYLLIPRLHLYNRRRILLRRDLTITLKEGMVNLLVLQLILLTELVITPCKAIPVLKPCSFRTHFLLAFSLATLGNLFLFIVRIILGLVPFACFFVRRFLDTLSHLFLFFFLFLHYDSLLGFLDFPLLLIILGHRLECLVLIGCVNKVFLFCLTL